MADINATIKRLNDDLKRFRDAFNALTAFAEALKQKDDEQQAQLDALNVAVVELRRQLDANNGGESAQTIADLQAQVSTLTAALAAAPTAEFVVGLQAQIADLSERLRSGVVVAQEDVLALERLAADAESLLAEIDPNGGDAEPEPEPEPTPIPQATRSRAIIRKSGVLQRL